MDPADNSLESAPTTAMYGYQQGQIASPDNRFAPPPEYRPDKRFSVMRYNRQAFAITGIALLIILLVGFGSLLLARLAGGKDEGAGNQAANYAVGDLSLEDVKNGQQLTVGNAEHLSVNGQLKVSNTVVLEPGSAPSSPVAGQIYYDKVTQAPYYYNGSQFVSLAPVAVPQHVTSLGGAAGVIALGNGLQVTGNQLSVSSTLLQTVANLGISSPRVTSLQGLTGDITLAAGTGISISGTTITNNGVVSLTSGSANLVITNNGSGNFTITDTGSGGAGTVNLGPALAQVDNTNNSSIHVNKTGTGNFLEFENNGVDSFVVDQNGQITAGTINYSQVQGAPATTVTSIGGISGAITLGTGLGMSGSMLSNTGVVSLTGTANQINVSSATGSVTLSLPQNIAVTSAPTFSGLTVSGLNTAGIVHNSAAGVLSTGAVALGAETSGNYVASLGSVTGLTVGGTNGVPGAVPTLSVVYGSAASTAVQGNTAITCASGTGNLSGGGNTVTLGSGGSCNNITIVNSPTFSGTLSVQGAGGVTIGVAGTTAGVLNLANTTNSNLSALQAAAPTGTGAATYSLPSIAGGSSDTLCLLTLANCAGAGGGVIASGGTQNFITKFTNVGGTQIGNSLLYDNGTTVGVGTTTPSGSYILDVNGNTNLGGSTTIANGATITAGGATINGTVTLNGNTSVTGVNTFSVGTGATTLGGTLGVSGLSTLSGGATINGTAAINTAGTASTSIGNATGNFSLVSSGLNVTVAGAVSGVSTLNASGTITFSSLNTAGIVHNSAAGVLSTGEVALGAETSGDYVANLGGLTGLSTTGNSGEGSTPTLSVIYGSGANTAVQGNTAITCASGTGNLSGGGNTVTLGTGGSCNNITIVNSPTFSGTLSVQGAGGVTIGVAGTTAGVLNLANGTNTNMSLLQAAAPSGTGNATYTLPSIAGGSSANICLSTGNCAGAGGGVTTAGGTTNQLAKFSGAQTIADSTITDDGSTVTTSVNLVVQGGSATIGTTLQDGALIIYDNGQTATIGAALTSSNRSYSLPDGDGEFCIKELGNCSGGAGGNAPTTAQYLTLALDGTLTAERVLTFNGTNFSVSDGGANGSYSVNTVQNINTTAAPTFGGLTLNGTVNINSNTLQGGTAVIDFTNFDVASNGNVTAGTYNGQTISATASLTGTLTVAGLATFNGGLTVETGDTFTVNGDGFTDLTGDGLQVTGTALTLKLQTNKGLEVDSNGLSLIDCSSGEILKYNGSNQWACAADAGSGGLGDDVSINGSAATGANFLDTTATGTSAGTAWNLNTGSNPDDITLSISNASATTAGAVTTGAQTFAGAKTFNDNLTIGDAASDTLAIASTIQGGSPFVFEGGTIDANQLTLAIASLTTDRTITLPDADGTICLQNSVSCGFAPSSGSPNYIQNGTALQTNANFNIQSAAAGSIGGVIRGAVSQTADLLQLQNSGGTALSGFNANGNLYLSDNGNVNIVLTSETNALVNVLQLGEDGSGVLKEQHFTTADQTGTGAGAALVMNAGAAAGLNQTGAFTVIAGGLGTGTGEGGSIFFNIAPGGASGSSVNTFQNAWGIDGGDGAFYPVFDNTYDIGYSTFRVRNAYLSNALSVGTNVAGSGALRLANAAQVNFRNAANTADVVALEVTAADRVAVGTALTVDPSTTRVGIGATAPGSALQLGSDAATVASGITFGSAGDTSLYRSAAGVLKTGSALSVVGHLGVGTDPQTSANAIITGTITGNTTATGITNTPTFSLSGNVASGNTLTGLNTTTTISGSNNMLAGSQANGTYNLLQYNSTGTADSLSGIQNTVTLGAGAGAVTNAYGTISVVNNSSSSTLTNAFGNYLLNPAGSGVITNAYGQFIEGVSRGSAISVGSAIGEASGGSTLNAALWLFGNGGTAASGITFGAGADTNLYRSAAGILQTGGGLNVLGAAGLTVGTPGSVAGNLNLSNSSSSRLVVLQGLNPSGTGNATIQIPSIAGGTTDTVCLQSLGNCTGTPSGDDVSINGSAATGANFLDTTATGTSAGTAWNLNTGSNPDDITLSISNASATTAGAVTTGAQTFAGAKTFNSQITAAGGIDLGTQTLQGTTAVIDFTNFDVSSGGNVTIAGNTTISNLSGSGTRAVCANGSNILISCGTNANGVTLQQAYDADDASADAIIQLSSAIDSLIVRNPSSSGTDSGYTFKVEQLNTGAVEGLRVESAGTGNLVVVRDTTATAQNVLTIADGGATTFQNQTNSTAAFQIQNAAGTSNLLIADTTNSRIGLGVVPITTAGSGLLQVGASGSTTAAQGISFGGDTVANLYRSAAGALKTDGTFNSGSYSCANATGLNADLTCIGVTAPSTTGRGVFFGSTLSDGIYNPAANILQTDDSFVVGGRMSVGSTTYDDSTLVVYDPNESITQTDLTQDTARAGINLVYDGATDDAYTQGLFWSGNDFAGDKPRAGIYLLNDNNSGTSMLFGTSNNFATGITNTALTLGPTGDATFSGDVAIQGGDLTTSVTGTATLFNTNAVTLNIGGAATAASGGINLAGGSGSTGCSIDGSNGNLTCSGTITTTNTSGTVGFWSRNNGTSTLQPATSGDNITTSGNISTTGSGSITSAGTLTVNGNTTLGDATSDTITLQGQTIATGSSTATTGTTTGTGTNTTTLTLTSDAFSVNDVVFIDNAGQDYYTRITVDPGTGSYTVSPAISFDNSVTVTKYNIQNIGATTTDYSTLNNRFFQGYFTGGVVTGTGSTTLSDGNLTSTGVLTLTGTNVVLNNTSNSSSSFKIQSAGGAETLLSSNTNTRTSGVTGNMIKIGNSTGTDTALTILQLDSATANPTTNLSSLNGGLFYNSTTNKVSIIENGTVKELCNKIDLVCGAAATTPLQTAYNDDVDGSDATIALTAADDSIIIQNPASGGTDSAYTLKIDQLNTGAKEGLRVESAGTGALLVVRDTTATAADVLTIANGGGATFKSQTNSTTAFQIQNAAGSNLFQVDSSNANITLNGLNTGETGAWASAGNNLPAARSQPSVVAAPNGYVYVMGGSATHNATLGTFDSTNTVYYAKLKSDGTVGSWTTSGNTLPATRAAAASVYANGFIYVLGGCTSGGNAVNTVYYAKVNTDGSTGSWQTNTSTAFTARCYHTAVVANGYMYVIGGSDTGVLGNTYYAKINADGSLGNWTLSSATGQPSVKAHASVVMNGYVYILGGWNTTTQTAVYRAKLNTDGTTGNWSSQTSYYSSGTNLHEAVTLNGYIYTIGGSGVGGSGNAVTYVRPNSDGSLGTLNTASQQMLGTTGYYHKSIAYNGYIYRFGGHDLSTTPVASVEYASTSRTSLGGSLDLIGLNTYDSSEPNPGGGSLTAGNTNVFGTLQVRDQASFMQSVSVDKELTVAGGALFKNQANSTTAFQVQNSAGNNYLLVNTSAATLSLGDTGIASTIQVGNTTGAVAQTVNVGNNTTATSNTTVLIGSNIDGSTTTIQAGTGGLIEKAITGNTTAYTLQDSGGVKYLVADTQNVRLYVGNPTADGTGTLLVLDNKNTSGDPTGVDGAMYYNSGTGNFRCYSNSQWADCDTPSLRQSWFLYEDWLSGGATTTDVGDLGWTFNGFGTSVGSLNEVAIETRTENQGRIGVLDMQTAAGNDSGISIQLSPLNATRFIINGVPGDLRMEWDFASVTNNTQQNIRMGMVDQVDSTAIGDGYYFQYDVTTTAGNWFICTASVGTRTCTDSGIAKAAINTYQRFKIETNSAGTQVNFYINEVSAGSISSGLPGTTTSYGPGIIIYNKTNTARIWETDYFQLRRSNITR